MSSMQGIANDIRDVVDNWPGFQASILLPTLPGVGKNSATFRINCVDGATYEVTLRELIPRSEI